MVFFELDADVIKMVKIIDMINENGWQDEVYKSKKPLKIKRLTTVIVLKAGLEPARPLLTTGF